MANPHSPQPARPLRLTVLVGTRPEAIKLAPLVLETRARPAEFDTRLIATGQHRDLAREALDAFGLRPDIELDTMRPGQDLNSLLARLLAALAPVLAAEPRPDWLLVQGDTTTVLAGALAAFHLGIPVGHVEAGLRTGRLDAPFPEEANRKLAAVVARAHFCATEQARRNLLTEGHAPDPADPAAPIIHVTGNTGIDALLWMADRATDDDLPAALRGLPPAPTILVTAHRRESFGDGLDRLAATLRRIATAHPGWRLVYPVHPNPRVLGPMRAALAGVPNILLIEPVGYRAVVRLLSQCEFVITDSGGLQEEAPALGKPVLVTREVTERPEAVEAGGAMLVGTDPGALIGAAEALIARAPLYAAMAQPRFPYGDGKAARRIADLLLAAPR